MLCHEALTFPPFNIDAINWSLQTLLQALSCLGLEAFLVCELSPWRNIRDTPTVFRRKSGLLSYKLRHVRRRRALMGFDLAKITYGLFSTLAAQVLTWPGVRQMGYFSDRTGAFPLIDAPYGLSFLTILPAVMWAPSITTTSASSAMRPPNATCVTVYSTVRERDSVQRCE